MVLRATSVANVLPAYLVTGKAERFLVDQLAFVIEPIQVSQITLGCEVFVDLQNPKAAVCFEAKVETGSQANIMPICVYDKLFGTTRLKSNTARM